MTITSAIALILRECPELEPQVETVQADCRRGDRRSLCRLVMDAMAMGDFTPGELEDLRGVAAPVDHQLLIRLTGDQHAELNARARAAGVSMAAYLRRAAELE